MDRLAWYSIPIGLLAVSITLAQEGITRGHYSAKPARQTTSQVVRVDVDQLKTNHLAKYQVQRKKEDTSGEQELVLYDKDNKQKVELRIRLCPSARDAENAVLDLLNSQSVIFTNGSPTGQAIGDNVWYFTTKGTGATTIIFTRNNVVVSVFAQDTTVAEKLAERVDGDMLAGKNGVELKEGQ